MTGLSPSAVKAIGLSASLSTPTSSNTSDINTALGAVIKHELSPTHLSNFISALPLAALAKGIASETGLPANLSSLSIEYGLHHAELRSGTVSAAREQALNARNKKIEDRFKELGAPNFILEYSRNICCQFADEFKDNSNLTKAQLQSAFSTKVIDLFNTVLKENSEYIKSEIQTDRLDPKRINQIKKWDCGPTAHAIALAPFVGVPPEVLAHEFRKIQRGGGMDWENPKKFVQYVNNKFGTNIRLVEQGDLSAEKIADYINSGYMVTASFGELITRRGHITAFGSVTPSGETFTIENLDPNRRNIERGLTQLTARQINRYSKQAWVFAA